DPALRLHARVKAEAMARGLMVYPMVGTIDARPGDHVLVAPPFIVTDADLDDIVSRLAAAVDTAIAAICALDSETTESGTRSPHRPSAFPPTQRARSTLPAQ